MKPGPLAVPDAGTDDGSAEGEEDGDVLGSVEGAAGSTALTVAGGAFGTVTRACGHTA